MEVVTISSDSETSDNGDVKIEDTSIPGTSNWFDECYNLEWDADDERPAINYNPKSPDKPNNGLNLEEEIEEFITPNKPFEKMKIQIDEDEQTVGYTYEINNQKYLETVKTNSLSPVLGVENFSQDSDSFNPSNKSPKSKTQSHKPKLTPEEKEKMKLLKKQNKLEKEKTKEEKKTEQQRQKALKAASVENRRNLKPEENIKFFKVHIDNEIINAPYGGNVITLLQQNNIQYVVESQIKSCTISWSKRKVEKVVDDSGCLIDNIENKKENQLLYVLDWQKAVKLVHSNELLLDVETLKSAYKDNKLTLIIYGMEKYFRCRINKKNPEGNDKKKQKVVESERIFQEAPFITRDQLEFALIDLQLLGKHNSRLLETPDEFAALVHNITKSLSQVDFKIDKQKRQQDLGWFVPDSNQSIKVDKNGNGLLRLWQQQICQFSAVGLETAQAIVSHYNSPLALVNHYNSCGGIEEGEHLLQNIQIRRNAGILSTTRRVGPQLSKKIYKFFTSDDPDQEL